MSEKVRRLRSECISCALNKYLKKYPEDASEEDKIAYMQGVLRVIAKATPEVCSPVMVRDINDVHEAIFGDRLVFTETKHHFNELMLSCEAEVLEKIEASSDPLYSALQYAMAGNYIDYGALPRVDEEYLLQLLSETADRFPLPEENYRSFKENLSKAKKLLYLTDNAGEIVMDKLLIRKLQELYPQISITVCVRHSEVMNDAMIYDAEQVGLTEIVPVITNGNNIAGTWEPELSEEAAECLNSADLIISKGQANFESLRMCGKNVYYIFLCKCDLFARMFQKERFSGMFIRDCQLMEERKK